MQAKRSQEYLFNLDHFILLEGSEDCIPLENRPFHPRLPSDLTELWELGKDINLAIDGQYSGIYTPPSPPSDTPPGVGPPASPFGLLSTTGELR
jgi:hypothetical protein